MIDYRQKGLLHPKNSAQLHLQDISQSTINITFLGTPHLSANLAKWADLLNGFKVVLQDFNSNIVDVLGPESEVLARIQGDFHTMLRVWKDQNNRDLNITCFYEELGYRNIGPVSHHLITVQ